MNRSKFADHLSDCNLSDIYDDEGSKKSNYFIEEFASMHFNLNRSDVRSFNRNINFRKRISNFLNDMFLCTNKSKIDVEGITVLELIKCPHSFKRKLKSSLLYLPNSLQNDCMTIQKLILNILESQQKHIIPITGPSSDNIIRKSRPLAFLSSVQKLLNICLFTDKSSNALRDETYCQLIRLANENPFEDECVLLVLQIMLCCLATFPPSKLLSPYLKSFLKKGTKSRRQTFFAKLCHHRLSTINSNGPRCFVPALTELEVVAYNDRVSIPILFHGCEEPLIIDGIDSWTTVAEVKTSVSTKLNVKDDSYFSIVFRDKHEVFEIISPEEMSILSLLYKYFFEPDDPQTTTPSGKFDLNKTGLPIDNRKFFNVDIVFQVTLFIDIERTVFGVEDRVATGLYTAQLHQQYLAGKLNIRCEADLISISALALLIQVGRCPTDSSEATMKILEALNLIVPPHFIHLFEKTRTSNEDAGLMDVSTAERSGDKSTHAATLVSSPQLCSEQLKKLSAVNYLNSQNCNSSWEVATLDDNDNNGHESIVSGNNSSSISLNSPPLNSPPQDGLRLSNSTAADEISTPEGSSKTWKLASPRTLETLETQKDGSKGIDICTKIRLSWKRLDIGLCSITEAQAAFIEKLATCTKCNARQFVVYIPTDSPTVKGWVMAMLGKNGERFRLELKRVIQQQREFNSSTKSTDSDQFTISSSAHYDNL